MRLLRSCVLGLVAMLMMATTVSAQVQQDFTLQCQDSVFLLDYSVAYWGPGTCIPPSPFAEIGKPAAGWGAASACTTGGSFACNPGDTFLGMTPAGTGTGFQDTTGFATMNITTTNTFVPGLTLNAFIVPVGATTAQKSIVLHLDGALLLNSAVVAQNAIVSFSLQRVDNSTGLSTNIANRQVLVANAAAQQASIPVVFDYVDRPTPSNTVTYTYRVAAQLISTSGPQAFTGDNLANARVRLVAIQNHN